MTLLELTLRICVFLLALWAAMEDVRHLRIRNTLVLIVAALFIPMMLVLTWQQVLAQIVIALVLFAVGAGLFYARLFGGGDAKLIGALALWVTPAALPAFLLTMTVSGGFLALAALGLRGRPVLARLAARTPDDGWFAALARGETVVPYGVAIAVAAALTLF